MVIPLNEAKKLFYSSKETIQNPKEFQFIFVLLNKNTIEHVTDTEHFVEKSKFL